MVYILLEIMINQFIHQFYPVGHILKEFHLKRIIHFKNAHILFLWLSPFGAQMEISCRQLGSLAVPIP